ncbi:MAG: hypothetical protein QOE37_2020 [Microbacteriaceae bacterium]|nr:hypothetical protein [Microbacteriaceae bacterium]
MQQLQARIRAMQATGLGTRTLPTHPALTPLLPGGALKAGVAYAVQGSPALALLLLAGPGAAGAWCGVVGMPDFGVEAAAGLGMDLGRVVLIPDPGQHWLAVTAQVADVLPVVLVRPPLRAAPGEVARLASRLRQRGATLVVLGPWAQAEATLEIETSSWTGLGAGSGYLAGREALVAVTVREVRTLHRVRMPGGFRIDAPASPLPDAPSRPVRLEAV